MKKSQLVLIALAVGIVFSSCSSTNPRYVSAPAVPNTAFFRQAGDMKFSGSANIAPGGKYFYRYDEDKNGRETSQVYGFDGQAAFAVSDHFLVSVGGMHRSELNKYNNDDLNSLNSRAEISYKRNMFDAGLGFYGPLGMGRTYFNFVAGVGLGNVKSNDDGFSGNALTDHRYHDASFVKYNLHPSFNFFFTRYFRMSIAPRFSFLKYYDIKTNYTPTELKKVEYDALPDYYLPVFEPSLVLQSGFRGAEWLKLDAGFHFSTNPNIGAHNLRSRNFLISLGFSVYPFRQ